MSIGPGFDPRWADPPDFILGITRRIWEDREIASLHRHYAPDLVVRSPASVVVGNAGVIAATLATLAEFPDRELLGEDVIWYPTRQPPDPPAAFFSSHRLLCTATHTGAGMYGAPSGRRLVYRILADCYCAEDEVRDEWLVRDQGAIVRQMGADVVSWTRDLIAREGGPETCVLPMTPDADIDGPYNAHGNDDSWGQSLADTLRQVMGADLSVIQRRYDRSCELHHPGHVTAHGHDAAERLWLRLRAALPTARFQVEHAVGQDEPARPPRAAVRWSLTGRHDGAGTFGAPSGASVHVMGITHAEFGPRGLRREWTLYDETAVWKQILLGTGNL